MFYLLFVFYLILSVSHAQKNVREKCESPVLCPFFLESTHKIRYTSSRLHLKRRDYVNTPLQEMYLEGETIMQLTTVKELFKEREKYLDKEITVGGWIRSIRDSKAFGFIVLNDGTSFDTLQIVYHDTMANFAEVSKLNVGASIIVKVLLVATPEAKQPFEIQATEVVVEGASSADYPLQKKRHTFEYLRTIPHLRARTNTFQAVFRVFPDRLRDPPVLPGAGLRLCPHTSDHIQ